MKKEYQDSVMTPKEYKALKAQKAQKKRRRK